MAKSLHLQISREAGRFLEELAKDGIDARQAIAQGLWLLERAYRTNRVALLSSDWHKKATLGEVIEEVFYVLSELPETERKAIEIASSRRIYEMIEEDSANSTYIDEVVERIRRAAVRGSEENDVANADV